LLPWLLLALPLLLLLLLLLLPMVMEPRLLICVRWRLAFAFPLDRSISFCRLAEVEAAEAANRVVTATGAVHTIGNLSPDRQHHRKPAEV
jgi:hypothetical protein